MPQPAQGPYGVPIDGPVLWATGSRAVSTYRYSGVFSPVGATARLALTPVFQVARGLVTATVNASAGTGTNILRLYQNGTLRSSVTVSGTGTVFSTSFTASDGDRVQAFVTNGTTQGMTVAAGTLSFVRRLFNEASHVHALGHYDLNAAAYTVTAALLRVPVSPMFKVARGQVYCSIIVSSGTGTNTLRLLRNGTAVDSIVLPSGGTYVLTYDAEDNDLIQLVDDNTGAGSVTISAGSTIDFVRARA